MAKDTKDWDTQPKAAEAPTPEVAEKPAPLFPGQGEPFVGPAPYQAPPPTEAQIAWFQRNQHFIRASHAQVQFAERGTLHADGSYVKTGGHVLDGMAGSIGVGVPVLRRR